MDWKKLILGLRVKLQKPKVNLVTFGNNRFNKSKYRLYEQAKNTDWFDKIFCYGEEDLISWGYRKPLYGRGAGYWWWKPVVIKEALSHLDYNDTLLYLDAGCSIQPKYKKRFFQYLKMLDKHPTKFLGFYLEDLKEKYFTKRDLFILMNCDSEFYTESYQIISGIFFIKKTEEILELLDHWENLCKIEHAINDETSYNNNYEGFEEHRHDQSVLSLLVKKYYGLSIKDETFTETMKYPVLATRKSDND